MKCSDCGAECSFKIDANPCWGEVTVVDEDLIYDEQGEIIDYYWVHACEGHVPLALGRPYRKNVENTTQELNAGVTNENI